MIRQTLVPHLPSDFRDSADLCRAGEGNVIGWRIQTHGGFVVLSKAHRAWCAPSCTESDPAYSFAAGRADGGRHRGTVRVDSDKGGETVLILTHGALRNNFGRAG